MKKILLKENRKIIVALTIAVITGGIFGAIYPAAEDSLHTIDPSYITYEEYLSKFPKIEYDKNKSNLTYGSMELAPTVEEAPDLIAVVGKNGKEGYVYKGDLFEEAPRTVEEALEQQNAALRLNTVQEIPVYEKDGVTMIDIFEISNN